MKNNHKKTLGLFFSLFLISGCATWSKTSSPYVNNSAMYKVDLPWGWMRFGGKDLVVTRDGLLLEKIAIARLDIDKKLEHTKKKFIKGMLPEEIAEVEIDDITGNPNILSFEIIENTPVSVSGQPGFRLIYAFRDKEGLKYKKVCYGFGYKDWVYTLSYIATADYYFDKNLQEFISLINSFKFLPAEGKGETTLLLSSDTKEKTAAKKGPVKELIEEPKAEPAPEPQVAVPVIPVPAVSAAEVTNYAQYYRYLCKTISAAAVKPEGAGSGTINAAITILADGTLESVEILEGSAEDVLLRQAVEKSVRGLAPYPAFPDDIKAEGKKTFTVTIDFRQR